MERRCISTITVFSAAACFLYGFMLTTPFNNYWQTSAVKLVLFLTLPLVYCGVSKCGKVSRLFTVRGSKKYMLLSAALGGLTFAVIFGSYALLSRHFDRQMILNGLGAQGITASSYPFVFAHIVFVNAFLEELFFRGFVFLTLYRAGYKKYAYIFSAVLFALYHIAMMSSWFSPEILALCVIGLVIAGLLFNLLDRLCDNIYGSLFVHIGANLAINMIGAYLFYF